MQKSYEEQPLARNKSLELNIIMQIESLCEIIAVRRKNKKGREMEIAINGKRKKVINRKLMQQQ